LVFPLQASAELAPLFPLQASAAEQYQLFPPQVRVEGGQAFPRVEQIFPLMGQPRSQPGPISLLQVLDYPALLWERHRPLPKFGRWQRDYRLPERPSEARAYKVGTGLTARQYQVATGLTHRAKQETAPEKKSTTHAHARPA